MRPSRRKRNLLLAVAAFYVAATVVARRLGYGFGTATTVRCRRGHLFTTIWIPGVSIKSIRLGWWRLQHCPVGRHWSIVVPVKDAALDAAELRAAREHRDARIP